MLRYHGGKWLLGKWIISHFPPHRTYTEVFGGGGSVLMQKSRSYAEIYNDKWDTVVNVFRCLRDPNLAQQLEMQLRLTPYSRTEFDATGEIDLGIIDNPVEKARRTILRSFAGWGSAATNAKFATGFRCHARNSGTTPAHDWANYPDEIQGFCSRLAGVAIENRHYADVLQQHDSPTTLHYLDPPYVHVTRNMRRGNAVYAHDFTDDNHREMAEVVHSLKGMVIISGYECPLYQELFKDFSKVSRIALADGASKRTECLWMSYELRQQKLF